MIQIKGNKIVLLLFFTLLLVIAGCAKAECKTSADCLSSKCAISKCQGKKCEYTPIQNCCGNGVKDSLEDGKTGSRCTCPQDYGKCEGKGNTSVGLRHQDAVYAHYYCDSGSKCVLGVESKDIVPQNFLDTLDQGFFKATSILKYGKPFDMSQESFEFKLTLDDAGKDLVLPIKLIGIRLLFSGESSRSELLIAEKGLDAALEIPGSTITIMVPLNLNYRPPEVEEIGQIRYVIDYAYTKKVPDWRAPDGTTSYREETAREKFNSPPKQIFFVRSE